MFMLIGVGMFRENMAAGRREVRDLQLCITDQR